MTDRNNLAYWFPILLKAGVPVPRTEIIETDLDLLPLLDGESVEGFDDLVHQIDAAAHRTAGGYPFFLRTGHGSGKHDWHNTCFVGQPTDLASNVAQLVAWSNTVDFLGLPTQTWVVREFLHLNVGFKAKFFGGEMPVAREFRVFIRDDVVQCLHPYWPAEAIHFGDREDWEQVLAGMNHRTMAEENHLVAMAGVVADQFDGYWSVDLAQSRGGVWYVTDMAEGDRSYHWEDCVYALDSRASYAANRESGE